MVNEIGSRFTAGDSHIEDTRPQYGRFFEVTLDLLCVADLNGVLRHLNPQWERILGYPLTELEGRSFLEFVHPEDRPATEAALARMAQDKSGGEFVNRCRCRDGSYRWLEWRASCSENRVFASARDVTEHKKADRALSMFQFATEQAADAIFWMKSDAGFFYVNEQACRSLGYTREELMKLNLFDIDPYYPPAMWDKAWAQFHRQEIRSESLESWHRRKDGSLIPVEVSAKHFWFDDMDVHVTFVRDITQRKRAEAALKQSEELLQKSQAVAHLGSYEFTVATGTWICTPELERLFGLDPGFRKDVDGWLALVVPADREMMRTHLLQHVLVEGKRFEKEYRIRRKNDGCERWVCGLGELELDQEGKPVKMIGTIQDITERKRLEEQLRHSQKMEAVGQLAGGVAHDFNNLLAVIMMQLGLLQTSGRLDPETDTALRELELQAERAARLTRQLLIFGRRSVVEPRVLDLNDVVTNLIKMLHRLLGETIQIVFTTCPGSPLVTADSGMLEQVLLNLVVNARDAMPQGGSLTVTTELAQFDEAQAALHSNRRVGRFAGIAVSDTGCGMTREVLARIFEPFFTTKEVGKGTGLGLAIVYGIVEQHSGWIEVESQPGSGTTFRVWLPAAEAPAAPAPSPPEPPSVQGGSETVLLVEDDPAVRSMVHRSLGRLGYRVIEASNAQEAMGVWRDQRRRVDLLFTDMVMPEGITGLELAQRLRTERPELQVIISSGYSLQLTGEAEDKTQDLVYLAKPYSAPLLAQTVRRCLDRQSR